ncbi:MAG: GspH/FimT family pseudopilin [Vicinamibacterales bacterium]
MHARESLRRRIPREAGFTLIEIQVVVLLIAIVGGMSVFGLQSALPSVRGDAAADHILSAMRVARDLAITQRRRVEVRFTPPNQIAMVRIDPNSESIVASVALESNPTFTLTAGLPDTPDAFGNNMAVDFGGAAIIRFNEDGTLSDGGGIPLNGTVFIGQNGQPRGSRAVTITGVTGRAQVYGWDGRQWQER